MRMFLVRAGAWLCLAGGAVAQPALPLEATITNAAQPVVTVQFSQPIRSAQIFINGVDYTQNANIHGNTLTLRAPYALPNGQHTVSAEGINILGLPERGVWHFTLSGAAAPPPPPIVQAQFTNQFPPAHGHVADAQPTIGANFPSRSYDWRLLIDGQEVTSRTERVGDRVTWRPESPLQHGSHTAYAAAVLSTGQRVDSTWTFHVDAPSAEPEDEDEAVELDLQAPTDGQRVGSVFEVEGTAQPLSLVTVTLRTGRKVVTFRGKADRAGYFNVPASAKWATRNTRINVEVSASGTLERRQVIKR